MNDLSGMIPYDSIGLYEQPKPRFIFKMPRVVPDQKSKFESDDLFRRLSRESDIRYTAYRDRPQDERQIRFQTHCREGHAEISFVQSGTNLQLAFNANVGPYTQERELDFDKEHGKVHIKSFFIMNGVCVRFRGYIDLERLEGTGCLEYDNIRAAQEDEILRQQLDRYNLRIREYEDNNQRHEALRRSTTGNIGVSSGLWRR